MSLLSKLSLLQRIRKGKDARAQLVESNLAKGIAFQIRATREAQNMTQGELAQAVGMSQNNISRLENPTYGKQTTSSLKRIAEALDVAVIVRLVPFSQYVDWLSGTPYLDEGLRPEALAVPKFEDEEKAKSFDCNVKYWPVVTAPANGAISESSANTSGVYASQIVPARAYELDLAS